MWMWVLPVASGVAFLAIFGRYNARLALRDWEVVFSPVLPDAIAQLEQDAALDGLLANRAHAQAVRARERAQLEEAVRLLRRAASVIAEAVPDRLTRLRGMAVCSRMAVAMLPMPPLLPSQFRLGQLTTATGAAALVHHILVTVEERFCLRLWVLGLCYRVVRGVTGHAVRKVGQDPGASAPWQRFDAGLADFATLDREQVEAFRQLLMSLAAA